MIRLIQGQESGHYPREMEAMFRARAAVFHRRLGWNVTVRKGREIDRYDAENPLYLVAIDDESGDIVGSARLLPTTGPATFGESFSELFEEPIDLASATVWECAPLLHPSHGEIERQHPQRHAHKLRTQSGGLRARLARRSHADPGGVRSVHGQGL